MESREVAFMGRITAGMTHEIKNVLAIIKESSGLLQDILSLGKRDAVPEPEQIAKVASRIQAQVARGNEQLTSLNWLAHSMSDRSSAVGINELSSEIANLMQRTARLKRVELEVQPNDRDATIHTDVTRLLVVLATCIEYCLDRESQQGRTVLRPGRTEKEATLEIVNQSMDEPETVEKMEAGDDALPSGLADLKPLLGPLGARLAFADARGGAELRLILPLRREGDQ